MTDVAEKKAEETTIPFQDMDTLLVGAYAWRNNTDESPATCVSSYDSLLMELFRTRMKAFESRDVSQYESKFSQLASSFSDDSPDDDVDDTAVILINKHTIVFNPLNVEPRRHRVAQKSVFNKLVQYWRATAEPIEMLVINLSPATMSRIATIMKGVTVADVSQGIRIWETFPCKIKAVHIHEPVKLPIWGWIIKKCMTTLLPSKLIDKIVFSKEIYCESPE